MDTNTTAAVTAINDTVLMLNRRDATAQLEALEAALVATHPREAGDVEELAHLVTSGVYTVDQIRRSLKVLVVRLFNRSAGMLA